MTDSVNQQKSDSGPEEWKPPLGEDPHDSVLPSPTLTDNAESYHCDYAKMWVKIKAIYELTITEDEKSALVGMLDTC